MHVLLAILSGMGAVLWVVWRLDKEGFDFASLNPFLWKRRAGWKRQLETDPVFLLTSPLEVAAVLLLAVAKETGEISLEEKRKIKELMVSELKRSEKEADDLFLVSSHLLKSHDSVVGSINRILAPSRERFDSEKIQSVDSLLTIIANIGEPPNQRQLTFISEFRAAFQSNNRQDSWA